MKVADAQSQEVVPALGFDHFCIIALVGLRGNNARLHAVGAVHC